VSAMGLILTEEAYQDLLRRPLVKTTQGSGQKCGKTPVEKTPAKLPGVRKRSRKEREHQEQCAVVEWATLKAKQDPRMQLLYAIPNGRKRSKAEGGKLKAEGLKAGMPDLCLPVANRYRGESALFLEMKTGNGTLSRKQKEIISLLRSCGNRVEVCRSAEEAIRAIEDHMGWTRPDIVWLDQDPRRRRRPKT